MVLPLSVANINEAPVFGSEAQGGILVQIPENAQSGAFPDASGSFIVFDFDLGDSIVSCSVAAVGFPGGLFDASIGNSAGTLSADGVEVTLSLASGVSLDHEATPTVSAQLTCTDSSQATATTQFEVRVVNVNEAPYMATRVGSTEICFGENPAAGELASGALRIDDPDVD